MQKKRCVLFNKPSVLSAYSPPQSPSTRSLASPSWGVGSGRDPCPSRDATPLKPRDKPGPRGAPLLLAGSPGKAGQWLGHTHHQGAGDSPPEGPGRGPLCSWLHSPVWGGAVGHPGKPDAQASLTQALPADPFRGPSWALGGRAYDALG